VHQALLALRFVAKVGVNSGIKSMVFTLLIGENAARSNRMVLLLDAAFRYGEAVIFPVDKVGRRDMLPSRADVTRITVTVVAQVKDMVASTRVEWYAITDYTGIWFIKQIHSIFSSQRE